jgi:hypothetical protein
LEESLQADANTEKGLSFSNVFLDRLRVTSLKKLGNTMAEVTDTREDKFLESISHDGHTTKDSLAEPLPWERPQAIEPIQPHIHTFQWRSPDS